MDNSPNPEDKEPQGYVLPGKSTNITPPGSGTVGADQAADLIRQKLEQIYAMEPSAREEAAEVQAGKPKSKHQEFMYRLSTSGKSLAEIQTEWHNYYVNLPDDEKHQVWREFYDNNNKAAQAYTPASTDDSKDAKQPKVAVIPATSKPKRKTTKRVPRTPKDIKEHIKETVSAGGKLQAKHHFQSLLFGLGIGAVVLFIFLFGFFNEVILAPFYQPSRHATNTPLIISSNDVAPTTTPEVIIPKINVEIPVVYGTNTTEESVIENGLEKGVVHYPTTAQPGEQGNAAYFGHSSNNIFNKGKYKFAFVLLRTLVEGDTFYLTNNGKVYVYKVISRTVVDPSAVGVLGPVPGQTATATLITCDPPGTSLKRLVVVGQQISPDPTGNMPAATVATSSSPTNLPGNGPTLWGRFMGWLF